MKKYIYKFFKVCIPLLLLVLITVFLIKKVNGGNVFLKKIASHETYDTEEDAFDLRKEQWNTDNNESFNTISEFSAVIFMKTYEVKSFTVIGNFRMLISLTGKSIEEMAVFLQEIIL
jgi:hypothetical protein